MTERKDAAKVMRSAVIGAAGVLVVAGGGAGLASMQYVPTVRPGVKLDGVELGGMTKDDALEKIRVWFRAASARPIIVSSPSFAKNPAPLPASKLGVELDQDGVLARLPMDNLWTWVSKGVNPPMTVSTELKPSLKVNPTGLQALRKLVKSHLKPNQKAKAYLRGGRFVRETEQAGAELDESLAASAIVEATLNEAALIPPLKEAPKSVSDEDLARIKTTLAGYSTRFNAGQASRSTNIARAAELINGFVMMPGEKFSFNGVVGRRTRESGFQIAGVYVSGRKDFDVGGGICQVSTTLYNAALLANLKIVKRSSHSRPVAYVPLGRDAAVSFTEPDLVFENNTEAPISLSAQVSRGQIRFDILSEAKHGLDISIVQGKVKTWSNGIRYENDPSLGFGVTKVIESGADGRSLMTWRVVRQNGAEIARDELPQSYYRGSARIIARNPNAKAPVVAPPVIPPAEAEPAAVTPRPAPRSKPESPKASSRKAVDRSGRSQKPPGSAPAGKKPGSRTKSPAASRR